MSSRPTFKIISIFAVTLFAASSATAGPIPFSFSTGNPDGLIGTLSRPSSPGKIETETADDFILTQSLTTINQATFIGLLPLGASLSTITNIEIELYRVFPADSANPPSGRVVSRVNSPSDKEFAAFDSLAGDITFTAAILNQSFTVANTVMNGIFAAPNQLTGGEGAATGEEVLFTVTFTNPATLAASHYFFRPEVGLSSGNFLWLSAPRPIVAGTPFTPDLQSWIRNANLTPDWERIGTDVVGGQAGFNAAFSLSGTSVPEPSTLLLFGVGLSALAAWRAKRT